MKIPAGINKWGIAVLGAGCVLLVANLVAEYRGLEPGRSRAHMTPASMSLQQVGRNFPHAADDLAKYDPNVHFDVLKKWDSRPLPDEDRNPFDFVGGAAPPPVSQAVAPNAKLPPPAPPPPPLKAMGYNELPGGKKEAMVTYNDDLVVVHEGDSIGTKYKVVTINPAMVVVEDGETHQNLELPFPQ